MGVSGCGKTTTGKALAQKLGWDFYDADDFHPLENIAKMAAGIPLTDEDRAPWLQSLRALISSCLQTNRPGVLACSALKERYRQTLLTGNPGTQLVYLKGTYNQIRARLEARKGHYMQPVMLQSQFDALEEPQNALVLNITHSVEDMLEQILRHKSI